MTALFCREDGNMRKFIKIISILVTFILVINLTTVIFSAEIVDIENENTAQNNPSIYIRDLYNRDYRVWAYLTDDTPLFDSPFNFRPKSSDKTEDEYGFKKFQLDKKIDYSSMYCISITKTHVTDVKWFDDTYVYGDIYIDVDEKGIPSFYDRNPFVEDSVFSMFKEGLWVDVNYEKEDTNSLVLWTKKADEFYLYLPSGASLNLPLYHTYSSLLIDNNKVKSGEFFTFQTDSVYDISGDINTKLHVLQNSGTSTMYINTLRDIPHNTCYNKNNLSSDANLILNGKNKLEIHGGNIRTTDEKGKIVVEDDIKKIKGRGNSSWLFSYMDFGKYSFNLNLESKTKKITDGNIKTKKYAVCACSTDESFVRNNVMYKLANNIGIEYTPTIKIYDVYNNGVYFGTYSVSEKVDIGSSSLLSDVHSLSDDNEEKNPDIESLNKSSSGEVGKPGFYTYVKSDNPDDITGGYLLEIDLYSRFSSEMSGFISNKGQAVTIQSPEYSTKEEVEYIKDFFNKIEDIIYQDNVDINELSKYIDIESFAKMFLINELSKDVDTCSTSYFMYKDSDKNGDGKLHAAPVWDYDWACGQTLISYEVPKNSNSSANCGESNGWNSRYRLIKSNTESGFCNFQAQLCQSDDFWNKVYSVWKKTFYKNTEDVVFDYNRYDLENSGAYISNLYNKYSKSFENNELKWGFIKSNPTSRFGTKSTGNDVKSTISYLNRWLFDRICWIDNNIGPAELFYGDANGDKNITIIDATAIQKVLANLINDDDTLISQRGTLKEDELTILDAAEIQKFLANLPVGDKINTKEHKDKSIKIK